jgi:hypothetical protein
MRRIAFAFDLAILTSLLSALVLSLGRNWNLLGTLVYCSYAMTGMMAVLILGIATWVFSFHHADEKRMFDKLVTRYRWLLQNESGLFGSLVRPILFVLLVFVAAAATSSEFIPLIKTTDSVTLVKESNVWSTLPIGTSLVSKPWETLNVSASSRWRYRHDISANSAGDYWRVDINYTATELQDAEQVLIAIKEGRIDPENPEPFVERKYLKKEYVASAIPWVEMGSSKQALAALLEHYSNGYPDVTSVSVSYRDRRR